MSLISFSNIQDGSTIDAADVNSPLNTLFNDYNGNIDSNNLANDAATPAKWTNPYCFRAYASGATTLVNGDATKILFATEDADYNNNFASSSYTVPVTGMYHFDGRFALGSVAGLTGAMAILQKAGVELARGAFYAMSNANGGYSVSCDVPLTAGNVISLYGYQVSDGNEATATGTSVTWFSGHLVSPR